MRGPRDVLTSPLESEPERERGPGIARLFAILAWGIAAAGVAYIVAVSIPRLFRPAYDSLYGAPEALPPETRALLFAAEHPATTLLPTFALAAIPLLRIRTAGRAMRLGAIYLAAGVFAAVILLMLAYRPLICTPGALK